MYTNYNAWLILASLILLLAMIGAIVITIKSSGNSSYKGTPLGYNTIKKKTNSNLINESVRSVCTWAIHRRNRPSNLKIGEFLAYLIQDLYLLLWTITVKRWIIFG